MLACNAPACSPAEHAAHARREYQWLQGGILLALALASAAPLALNLVDPDLWGHVRYGQQWLAAGELPRTATHTFTAVGHPWINHENLAELALALGYKYLGVTGLLVAKCLWGVGILLLMAWIVQRHDVHPFVTWTVLLFVATNLQPFFPLRPQLLSFGLCAASLVILDRAFRTWHEDRQVRWPLLWLLPLVMIAWANSHGGFVAGLCIVGAYLAGRIIELLLQTRPLGWRTACGFAAVGLACVAATFANPYGWQLHGWLAVSLSQPRPEVTEWLPPRPDDPTFWPWLGLLSIASVSLLATRAKRDWVQITILTLVAWQSALHLRHIAFLALLCGFWLPVHVQSALSRLRPRDSKLPVMRLSPWLLRAAAAVLGVSVSLQSYALGRKLMELPVERNFYPVDAIQFMADCGLHGKLVVAFNWAQYALAALDPDVQVAFDGRYDTCYPVEVADMHFDFLLGEFGGNRCRSPQSGPLDGSRVLDYGSPDLVLLDRRYEESVAVMQAEAVAENPEWVLLFRDRVAELWGRASRYDDPHSPDYFPLVARVQDPRPRDGAVPWPAFPVREHDSRLSEWQHDIPAIRRIAVIGADDHGDD
jgi:hypothetical protein